jgi:hypothetical protein
MGMDAEYYIYGIHRYSALHMRMDLRMNVVCHIHRSRGRRGAMRMDAGKGRNSQKSFVGAYSYPCSRKMYIGV